MEGRIYQTDTFLESSILHNIAVSRRDDIVGAIFLGYVSQLPEDHGESWRYVIRGETYEVLKIPLTYRPHKTRYALITHKITEAMRFYDVHDSNLYIAVGFCSNLERESMRRRLI